MHYEDYVEYAESREALKNRWRRGVFAPDAVLEVQPKWLDMTHCPFEGLGLRCPYLGGKCGHDDCIPF